MGLCYNKGEGVKKDISEAVKWYRKSAEQGIPEAQYNLGVCYAEGEGVKKDISEAVKWLVLATKNGDETAPMAMVEMRRKLMTKSQIEKAQELAEKYEKGNFEN